MMYESLCVVGTVRCSDDVLKLGIRGSLYITSLLRSRPASEPVLFLPCK
jgi:hypothetical protein